MTGGNRHSISGGSRQRREPELFGGEGFPDAELEDDAAGDAIGAAADDGAAQPAPEEPQGFDLGAFSAEDLRWSWVQIDTKAILHNMQEFRKRIPTPVKLLAVVKADAYGHGAVPVARLAIKAGASWLAVATVREGIELRQAGITEPILILAEPPAASVPAIVEFNLVPAVYSLEFALALGEEAAARGKVADYHLAVNTGMNRIGVLYSEVADFLRLISFHAGLNLAGTFTHFAMADTNDEYAFRLQLKRFNEALVLIRRAGQQPGIVHCANSAAAIRFKEAYFDMVRVGISLYGLHPSPVTRRMIELWPAMSVHARITAAKDVPVGEGVSYNFTYRSPGNVRICTVPIGYADGLARELSNHMKVIYNGKLYPQAGNICMDQFMFEVDRRSTMLNPAANPEVGDHVIVVGREGEALISLDEMADRLGTINYELACRFGMRMEKVYV